MRTRSITVLFLNPIRSRYRSFTNTNTTTTTPLRARSSMSQSGSIIQLAQKNLKGEQVISDDVFYVLNDYFQAEKPITPNQAAQAITGFAPEPTIDSDGNKTLSDGYFESFWKEIFHVVEQIPFDHPAMDKIVMFMRELTLLSETDITLQGSHLWTHLPGFALATRAYINGPSRSDDPEEQAGHDRRWVRYHAFHSKCMAAGVGVFLNQAIWMVRAALEEESQPQTTDLDRGLMTAAMYVEWFGFAMAQMVAAEQPEQQQLSKEQHRLMRGGTLYGKDKSGLTAERWRFWIGRFREEAGRAKGEEAKRWGQRAARLMEMWMEGRF